MRILFCIMLLMGDLAAQSSGGPLMTTPPLSQVFPMIQAPSGVLMAIPVLINETSIIPARAVLRVCYIRPQVNNAAANQIFKGKSFEDGAMSRDTEARKKREEVSPELQEAIRIATKTVWPVTTNFEHAFELMGGADLRVVFVDPKTGSLTDEVFNLPEGLFLGEKDNKVVVLAVENERSGQTAGFLAGDQILEIAGKKLDGTLASFVEEYPSAIATLEQSGRRKLPFLVQRPGEAAPRTLTVTRPPSLNGSLLDIN